MYPLSLGIGLGLTMERAVGGGGPPRYVGPLDIVSNAVIAFGQRAMSAADRGSALYTIREDSGNTTQSFSSDATTGAVPSAAIISFLNGANGFVTQLVNKGSASTNPAQATTTMQPQWQNGIINSLPGIWFDGVDDFLLTPSDVTISDPWTVFSVVVPGSIGGAGAHRAICGQDAVDPNSTGPDWTLEPFISSTSYWITMIAEDTDYNNILDADIADPPIVGFAETPHIVDSVFSIFASADLYVDGASRGLTDTGSTGTNLGTFTEPFAVGQNGQTSFGPSNNYGHIVELLVYPGIVSAPNRLAIRQNMATYYGITLL